MKKKRILFPYVGKTLGGSHIASLMLSQNISKEKYESIVFVHKKGKLTNYLNKNEIKWITHRDASKYFDGRLSQIFFLIFRYRNILKDLNVDIVHTQDAAMHLTWLLPCKLSNIHHIWHQRAKSGNKIIFLANLSSKIISVSHFIRNNFPKSLIKKTSIISDPILYEKKTFNKKKVTNLRVCVVANLQRIKRIDIAIKVISKLKKTFDPKVILQIFGEKREPVFSELMKIVRDNKLEDNIKFMGAKNPITNWMLKSQIMLATSQNEGLGLTVLEAMSLGVPVVASNHGGHKETIKNNKNGFLVELEDIDGYVDVIMKLYNNTSLKNKIIRNGKKTIKEKYSLNKYLDRIDKVYKKLIKN